MPEAVGMELGKEPKSNQADALQDIIFLHQNYPDNEWLGLTNHQESKVMYLREIPRLVLWVVDMLGK